ncbi:MAG: nitrogenase iron protein [Myxococcales bacterium]|nr:MAG: nitrogenase iron protein [Myxococcales bacterium]
MEKIVLYGKGGIGKSTVAANLSAVYAKNGKKVIHIGCDPKHDSSSLLIGQRRVKTVIKELFSTPSNQVKREQIIMPGVYGIDCVEAGGPEPGVGCGGRGITRMFEALDDLDVLAKGAYEVAVFDVLGDVVCGGFAAPLRSGYAEKIFIVTSEEVMSLYAANNICKAVKRYEPNGVVLGGLIANIRDTGDDASAVERFAKTIQTQVVAVIGRDPIFREAERRLMPLIDLAPDHKVSKVFQDLADRILALDVKKCSSPKPLDDDAFDEFVERHHGNAV